MDSSEILFCEMFLNSFSFADFFLVLNFLCVNHSFCSATRSWLYSKVGHQGRCQRPGQRLCLQEENLTNKMDGAPKNYKWTIFILLKIKTTPSWTKNFVFWCFEFWFWFTSSSILSTGQYALQAVTFKKIFDKSSISYMLPNTLMATFSLTIWL